jgi:hypothetical protein
MFENFCNKNNPPIPIIFLCCLKSLAQAVLSFLVHFAWLHKYSLSLMYPQVANKKKRRYTVITLLQLSCGIHKYFILACVPIE